MHKICKKLSKSEVQTTWSLVPQCSLVCALWLHKHRSESGAWMYGTEEVSVLFPRLLSKVLRGLSKAELQTSQFHSTRLQMEFTATHPAALQSRLWMLLECAPSPSISTLHLQHMPILCPLTLLHSFSSFMSLAVIFHLSESLFSVISSLTMTGFQTGVRLCHIRRQRQATPRYRGHHCGGVRCAAKWTSHGTTFVSWPSLWQDSRNLKIRTWL